MARIEITTVHKISITYDLASAGMRILAFIVDLIVLSTFYTVAIQFWVLIVTKPPLFFLIMILFPVTFYTFLMELFNNGQTLGKLILGIRVIRIDGRKPTVVDLLTRWLFRVVDIWGSLGTVGLILITSSDKNQRLGDLLANTTIIRVRTGDGYSLRGLESIHRNEDHTPVYPEVVRMTEEEMVQVKTLLDRLIRYPTEGHLTALDIASERIAQSLGIKLEPYHHLFETNPIIREEERNKRKEFLKRLLKDYIILTR